MDMKERLKLLDKDGIDKAILYPTIGLLWEAEVEDPELTNAYCRAYNRWIADFCRDSGGRLIPIAHLSLLDIPAAIAELERAVKDGCSGAFVSPFNHHTQGPRSSRFRSVVREVSGARRSLRDSSDLRAGLARLAAIFTSWELRFGIIR